MSWQQPVFTYIIPINYALPWDGAVSNARTYTLNGDELLNQFQSNDYVWEK